MLACTRLALHKGKEMSEIKRYHEFKNGVVENEHGMFVKHQDYAALQQRLDTVLAENAALKDSRKRLGEFIIEEIDADYPLNMEMQTPATDAALNTLRAEGAIAVRDALVICSDGSDIYSVATEVANRLRAETDTTPSQYESLAGGK